jgi:halogenation protein CepH
VSDLFDVIVVGGGPAGSTVAGFLNKMGHRVLLLEREVFPRHHIGESMIAATFDILAELGLEEKITAANFPVKSGGCYVWGQSEKPWCIRFDEIPGRPTAYQVQRSVFDKLLLDHCAECGVDVRQGHRVIEAVRSDGRVTGVVFRDPTGQEHVATARYIVDASGLAALLANQMSRRVPAEELKNMCLYGYWRGDHPAPVGLGGEIRPADRNNIIIKMIPEGWLWFIPLGQPGETDEDPQHRQISVGFVAPRQNLPEGGGKAILEQFYLDRIRATPEWNYLLQSATYTGEFHTIKDWSYRSEHMAGPGYFTVGDASCFVDPILSAGVFLSVLYAKMCAVAVNTILTTEAPEELIHEWYQGLYLDSYSDYLEMARYWYHGHREVGLWMDRAQQQLTAETEAVFADTKRDAFIGLATGNTHAHPNYLLLRQLKSFPLPLYLRKDTRVLMFKDYEKVLSKHIGNGDATNQDEIDRSKIFDAPVDVRKRFLNLIRQDERRPSDRFSGAARPVVPPSDLRLAVTPKTRLTLEDIDDVVRLVVRAPGGERRAIAWGDEYSLLATFADPTHPATAAERARVRDTDVAAFCSEMTAAGVLAPATSDSILSERR